MKPDFTYDWAKEPEIIEAVKSLESNCYVRDKIIAEAAMKVVLRKQDQENNELFEDAYRKFSPNI